MRQEQFEDWFDRHCRAFPGVRDWLKRQGDADGILQHWMSYLEPVGFLEAVEASQQLYEAEDQPRGFGDHPKAIRRLVQEKTAERGREERKRQIIDGVEVFDCGRCQDLGWFEAVRKDSPIGRHVSTYGVRCDCPRGDQRRSPRPFDASRDLHVQDFERAGDAIFADEYDGRISSRRNVELLAERLTLKEEG